MSWENYKVIFMEIYDKMLDDESRETEGARLSAFHYRNFIFHSQVITFRSESFN
jgi:hypothetical protein